MINYGTNWDNYTLFLDMRAECRDFLDEIFEGHPYQIDIQLQLYDSLLSVEDCLKAVQFDLKTDPKAIDTILEGMKEYIDCLSLQAKAYDNPTNEEEAEFSNKYSAMLIGERAAIEVVENFKERIGG